MKREQVSTGTKAIDTLLGGGLEKGLVHLFYGDRSLHSDIIRTAVNVQLSKHAGGIDSPTVIIDSANMIKIEKIADFAFDAELEPEEAMDRIYISRAFNSSQTYDLVMNQLESFFNRVPAKLLIVSGLADLYISEGLSGDSMQQISHMASKLMTFTLSRELFTIVTAPASPRNSKFPAGGKTLSSCAQIHVNITESQSYFKYILTKHPQYPVRRTSRAKRRDFGTTLPLSHFLGDEEE
jgi:RecA/RadA recombinase